MRIKAVRAEAKGRAPGFRVRSRRRPQDESHMPEAATPGDPADRRRRRPSTDDEDLGRGGPMTGKCRPAPAW